MNKQVRVMEQAARNGEGRTLRSAASAAMAWLLAAVLVLTGAPAYGAENEAEGAVPAANIAFSGVDFMQPNAQAWEVLRADGLEGAEVYLDIEKTENGETTPLGARMAYQPSAEGDGAGDNVAQIIALNLKGATPADSFGEAGDAVTYTVRVYAESRGGEALYEGTVYPVYAELRDGEAVDGYELVGIRTASAAERAEAKNFGVGTTFYKKGADGEGNEATIAYGLEAGKADNRFDAELTAFVVPFQKIADDAVKGSVRYVTLDGTVVRTDTVTAFENGEATVAIEKSFVQKGRYYRAISNLSGANVTLTAANAHAVVRVVEVAEMAEKDYSVTLRYVDEADGELLWSDTLDIRGYGYQYTLPTSFSMVETDGVNFYTLEGVEGAEGATDGEGRSAVRDWGAPTVKFDNTVDPDVHFLGNKKDGYYLNAKYVSSDVTRKATLTLVAVDGSTGRLLPADEQPGSFPVTPEKEARFTPAEKVIDGVTYVPWSGNADEIVYRWDDLAAGVDLRQYVYYVPEGYAPDEAYDVTVQYMNIADSSVVRTETVTVEPGMTDYLVIESPERFNEGGDEYVRLAGQETGIRHGYFTPTRTYTVYYRDVNDVINADTVIRRTQIIETERVVEVPNEIAFATTLTAAPVAAAAAPAGDGAAVDAGVAAGDGATVINDDDNPLANLAGQDTTTERTIEDNETPMAAGEPGSEDLLSKLGFGFAAGVGVVALAAAGVAVFMWLRRKNEKKTAGELAETDHLNE